MNEINFYKIKNVKKSEIREVLKEANQCIDDNNFEFNSAHNKNISFKAENSFSNNDLLRIFRNVEIRDFCHVEMDSKYPTEKLYCFKLYREFSRDLEVVIKAICEEEVLIKFKLRDYANKRLFIMTIHYPDSTKESWTYIWKKDKNIEVN